MGCEKRVFEYLGQKYWAEGGFVHIVRESDGEHEQHSPGRFNEIVQSQIRVWKRMKRTDPKQAARMKLHLDDMVTCWRQAVNQGDPTNPEVRREILREKGYGRIVVPGSMPAPKAQPLILPKDLSIT